MKPTSWIAGIVIALAGIGLISYLNSDPMGLLKYLFLTAAAAAAIYAVYKFWSSRKPGGKDKQAFLKAARQSKRRAKKRQAAGSLKASNRPKPIRKKSAANLTVIEGKKSKKKNRAIF